MEAVSKGLAQAKIIEKSVILFSFCAAHLLDI